MPPIFSSVVPEHFDAPLVEECLRAQSRLEEDTHVVSVTEEQLTGHEGNSGTVLMRLRIEYSKQQVCNPPPVTLVLKYSDTSKLKGPSQRDSAVERLVLYSTGMSDVNMLQREAIFYNKYHEMVSDPAGLKIPDIFYTGMSGHSNILTRSLFVLFKRKEHVRGVILMEDLSKGQNLDAVEVCPTRVLSILCVEIGRMYGYTAKALAENNDRMRIGPGGKLPRAFTYTTCLMTSGVPRLMKRRWSPQSNMVHKVMMRWGDSDYAMLKQDADALLALQSLEKHFVPHVYKLHQRIHKYACVLHGDFHAGNFMIMPNGDVKMFDMQMWGLGHPAEELCYFLASNVEPTEENDDLALRMVHTAMQTSCQGVVDYPYEEFRRDVDICTLHYLAACIVRRALFDSPESVAKLRKHLGPVMDGIQRVLKAREQRLVYRCKQIWRKDPNFAFARVPKSLEYLQQVPRLSIS
jgi:hypothetical protein